MPANDRPRLLLSAFLMNTTSHILGGLWRHPEAQQHRFNELKLWTDLAKDLEAAKFDALFFADVVGLYGDYDGGWASHIEKGLQVPANDPLVLASALAATTEDIGIAVTSSVIQAHPFQFARQLSTLDHLSNGRVAWNIVTSVLENAHRNFGGAGLEGHDDRYEWAEEYVDVAYKLWEGSWIDGALLADKSSIHADPAGVSKINHRGPRYSVDGPHLSAPSAQRTPFLFQAGSSPRGQQFAAKHAEATFLFSPNLEYIERTVTKLRDLEVAAGRSRGDVKAFAGVSFVVGSTEAEVKRNLAEQDEYLDVDALLSHTGGGFGIDFSGIPHDTLLSDLNLTTEGAQGLLQAAHQIRSDGRVTLGDLARWRAKQQQITGTPEQIVDAIERYQDAGIDGLNIVNQTIPGSYHEFIDGVLPELRRRGLAQSEYAPGTLREKVFGRGARLEDTHPAAQYRGAFSELSAAATNKSRVTV